MKFWKLSGAGNDFVLIEARALRGRPPRALAKRLCARRTGIGADGLLVASGGARPRISYFNADGSEAFCGNGSRAGAWWLNRFGGCKRRFAFATKEGTLEARVHGGGRVSVSMPDAENLRRGLKLAAAGRSWNADFIDTGVPHAVVRVPAARLDAMDVATPGRALRFHSAFGRPGANVDFVAPGPRLTTLRTYERGVEGETLACGSGAVAAGILSALWRGAHGPVRVAARGGDVLTVSFKRRGDRFTGIWLEGPVQLVYEGESRL